ncbi:hypothetical protein Ahy_A04g017363 [Arachis hypogaea]|uniref:Uncharacterized protein n=1 Tax=Arachis hypogaea TaxID=3818 RepID=A0A445DAU8_ARAHY|nr:hypothetical protein Ahy_A04g017363 [Arachis hypogaea]
MVVRIRANIDGNRQEGENEKEVERKERKRKEKKTKKKKASSSESDPSESELDFSSESEVFFANDCLPSRMKSRKRKQILEDSTSESESILVADNCSCFSRMKKVGVPSTEGHYDSSKTLSLEEESVSDPTQQKMIVFQSPSEPLNITPQSQKLDESTSTVPPASSKINTTTVALMMMANTASYVPKEFLMPSFSLGFTDSSQEEILTQERQPEPQKEKSPETPILIEELGGLVEKIANSGVKAALDFAESKSAPIEKQPPGQIFEKFETPAKSKLMLGEMKEKCYL